jgi:hypothetical protein
VRVTKEKDGHPDRPVRVSYTFCFYDAEVNRLSTVLHVPGHFAETFSRLFQATLTLVSGSADCETHAIASEAFRFGYKCVHPETEVKPWGREPMGKQSLGTNLGDELKRVRTNRQEEG